MAQPAFKTDILQIEPGASGTRTISRDSTAGELYFVDPLITGITLTQLVGLRNITGIFIVGRNGDGAPYTAVQDAHDAIPTTSSPTEPSLILIGPGVYQEDVTISRDGVYLIGLGGAAIQNLTAGPTIHVTQDEDTTPTLVVMRNLTVTNTEAGEAVLYLDGTNTFAEGSATVVTTPLVAGDVLTINGVDLTGVAGARTSGNDDFNASLGSTDAIASDIASAINDSNNSFDGFVSASVLGSDITLVAATPGVVGNTITLAATTVPAGGITVSGVTLEGGGGLDSEVGLNGISILNCDIVASGVGTKQILAETVNFISVQGGSWRGSASTSESTVSQCAAFRLQDVEWTNDINVSYDSTADAPSDKTCAVSFIGVGQIGDVISDLEGLGSLVISTCPVVGDLTLNGDRTFDAAASGFGDIAVEDTVAATLAHCRRGTVTGSGTLAETLLVGSEVLAATDTQAVTFDVEQPDASYAVNLETDQNVTLRPTLKAVNGFTIQAIGVMTGTVWYTIARNV